jgi:hypothetical protein
MLIKTCLDCKYHEIKPGEEERASYCARENCWSQYSKCLANRALHRFLEQETWESE